MFTAGAKGEQPFELGMSAINIPFAIPNFRVEAPEVDAHTRVGWFRSVSNIPHAFAVQSFVAELAAVRPSCFPHLALVPPDVIMVAVR